MHRLEPRNGLARTLILMRPYLTESRFDDRATRGQVPETREAQAAGSRAEGNATACSRQTGRERRAQHLSASLRSAGCQDDPL